MGRQTGRTTKMLIQAIQAAADEPGSHVVVVAHNYANAKRMCRQARDLARAMGFTEARATGDELDIGYCHKGKPVESTLYFRNPERAANISIGTHHIYKYVRDHDADDALRSKLRQEHA